MPFAILDHGAPVELPRGEPFTTLQLKIMTEEDSAFALSAIGTVIDHPIRHAANALDHYAAEDLERYCIQQLDEPGAPAGQVVASRELVVAGGVITVAATFADPAAPERITRMQLQLELLGRPGAGDAATLLDQVDATIARQPDRALRIYWAAPDDCRREDPRFAALAAAMSWSDDDVADLFRGAAQRT